MRRWILLTATLAGFALLTVGPEPGFAAWPPDGLPICQATGAQDGAKMIPDGSGGAYIVWLDRRISSTARIYMHRVTAQGAISPGWPVDGLYLAEGVAIEMIQDGAGGALVATQTFDQVFGDYDILLFHVLPAGTLDPLWPVGGAQAGYWVEDQRYPTLVPDGAGGTIVAWQDERIGGGDAEIYADRINSSGVSQWLVGGKPIAPGSLGRQPIALADGVGGTFISSVRYAPPDGYDLYLQRVTAGGATSPGWPATGIAVSDTTGNQFLQQMAPDGAGGLFLAWQDKRKGTEFGVYALRMTEFGDIAPGWIANGNPICDLAGSNQEKLKIIAGLGGSAIIVWEDTRDDTADVYAQHVSEGGELLWEANGKVIIRAGDYQEGSAMVSDGEGGAIVVWSDFRTPTGAVRAQHIVNDGRFALPDSGLTVCTEQSYRFLPALVMTPNQDAIVAFADFRNEFTTGEDIYAQYLTGLSNLDATEGDANWTEVIVPRNLNDAVLGNPVVVSPILDGNTDNTYFNWLFQIEGPNSVPAWKSYLLTDLEGGWYITAHDSADVGRYGVVNTGPSTIRGGRHSLTSFVDLDDWIPESNESDNVWEGQWVWSPLEIFQHAPLIRPLPPHPGNFANPNTDGFVIQRPPGYSWVTAMMPHSPTDDYDFTVYDNYSSSTSGFSNQIARSLAVGMDFVVGYYFETPLTVYPAVDRFALGDAPSDFTIDYTTATGREGIGSAYFYDQIMDSHRLADVYDAFFTAGDTVYITLKRNFGGTDILFGVCRPDSARLWWANYLDMDPSQVMDEETDTLKFVPTISAWHPIVVLRFDETAIEDGISYNLTWSPTPTVDVPDGSSPTFTLSFDGAWPNPMTESTQLRFTLAERGQVQMTLYDLRGRQVRTLLDENREAGPQTVAWDGRGDAGSRVGAGIYWAQLKVGGHTIVKRIAVLR